MWVTVVTSSDLFNKAIQLMTGLRLRHKKTRSRRVSMSRLLPAGRESWHLNLHIQSNYSAWNFFRQMRWQVWLGDFA
ncbi:hypothetical protein EXD76_08450 [BEV proteobacterium]|nr:hypothetical protein [Candidatus Symbiopectobacterium sp. Chty_BC]